MTCKSISVTSRAFVKMQLHAAKYPHRAVNGLLLACKETFAKEGVLLIVDTISLFHQCIQLTPMLDVAFTNVDAYCKAYQLIIAGYYEAPEYINASTQPSLFASKVGEKMHNSFEDSKLVTLENRKLPSEGSVHIFDRISDGVWKTSKCEVEIEKNAVDIVEHLLERKVERDLCDYDNHLDDITLDWLNNNINQLVVMN